MPVEPTQPITSPAATAWPQPVLVRTMWAYTVAYPPECWMITWLP